ncbi:MAG: AAA family ATPase [Phototrophicaceae bacterium]
MLTRLQIKGFKNLVDVDVRFGPFTCIAGANGVGKSNLFDAIRFLSALADGNTFFEAAQGIRGSNGNPKDIFQRVGGQMTNTLFFAAEMIVPSQTLDDLGQAVLPETPYLRYELALRFDDEQGIQITNESLVGIAVYHAVNQSFAAGAAFAGNGFDLENVGRAYLSLNHPADEDEVGAQRAAPLRVLAAKVALASPRTILSSATANHPTLLLARREMQSWQVMQLDPNALRQPDAFYSPVTHIGADGAHLPKTLYSMAKRSDDPERVYATLANRLAQLIDDVRDISLDHDDKNDLLTLQLKQRDGTSYPARALSDGTLRFLALAIVHEDDGHQGLICLEEPENGIHPARIPAMLQLLQDIAVDTQYPVDSENPLRQVIINTHSTEVVQFVPADSLLFAELRPYQLATGERTQGVIFKALTDTWRTHAGTPSVALGQILAYLNLNPFGKLPSEDTLEGRSATVIEHPEIRPLFLPELETVAVNEPD